MSALGAMELENATWTAEWNRRRMLSSNGRSDSPVKLPFELRCFLAIVVFLCLASIADGWARWALNIPSHGFLWLSMPDPYFDLFCYYPRFLHLHSQEFFSSPGYRWYYPAPAIFGYYPFYRVLEVFHKGRLTRYLYDASALALAGIGALWVARRLVAEGVQRHSALLLAFATLLVSWPLYFSLQRGNIEALTWILVAAGLWACATGRWMFAAMLLGAVGSIKIYPLLCLALFLRPRRFKEIAVALLTAALATLAALRLLERNVADALHQVLGGLSAFTVQYAQGFDPVASAYDHSIFGIIKVITHGSQPNYPHEMNLYFMSAAVVALVWFFTRIIRLPFLNQVVFVLCCTAALPPVSFDYTLLMMYLPFALLAIFAVQCARQQAPTPGLLPALVLLAVLVGPETFLVRHGWLYAGQIKGCCLIMLMIVASTHPWPRSPGVRPDKRASRIAGAPIIE